MNELHLTNKALVAPVAAYAMDDMLKRLAQLKILFNHGYDIALPKVDLLLGGESRVSGILLDYAADTVLLLQQEDKYAAERLIYVSAHSIRAFSLEYCAALADVLNLNHSLPSRGILSKFKLQHTLKELGEQTGSVLGMDLTLHAAPDLLEQESTFRFIAIMAEDLARVLESMAAETVARELLVRRLKTVMILGADVIDLQWGNDDTGQLNCLCQPSRGGAGRLSKSALLKRLEKLL